MGIPVVLSPRDSEEHSPGQHKDSASVPLRRRDESGFFTARCFRTCALFFIILLATSVLILNSSNVASLGVSLKPIHPLHHGIVTYTATRTKDNKIQYSRQFTVPCGYGLLVFNVGPARDYEPFKYDLYEDGYVYDDNQGLCFFYPKYHAYQNGDAPFWGPHDPTKFNVKLGLTPQKISSRVVAPRNAKSIDPVRGGDYVIISKHNFYTAAFYQQLKATINSWQFDNLEDAQDEIMQQLQELEQGAFKV